MGFFDKLKQGLSKTKNSFEEKMNNVFSTFRKVDEDLLEELEEILIMSDVGIETSTKIINNLREKIKKEKIEDAEDVKQALREEIKDIFDSLDNSLHLETNPSVILVVGVNGVGKTTSIGKIANRLKKDGKKVSGGRDGRGTLPHDRQTPLGGHPCIRNLCGGVHAAVCLCHQSAGKGVLHAVLSHLSRERYPQISGRLCLFLPRVHLLRGACGRQGFGRALRLHRYRQDGEGGRCLRDGGVRHDGGRLYPDGQLYDRRAGQVFFFARDGAGLHPRAGADGGRQRQGEGGEHRLFHRCGRLYRGVLRGSALPSLRGAGQHPRCLRRVDRRIPCRILGGGQDALRLPCGSGGRLRGERHRIASERA